jgi:hypothetical protein
MNMDNTDNPDISPEDQAELEWVIRRKILEDDDFARMFIGPGKAEQVTDGQVEELRAKLRAVIERPN